MSKNNIFAFGKKTHRQKRGTVLNCCKRVSKEVVVSKYSSKLLQKEILRARKIQRNELLDKKTSQGNDNKLTSVSTSEKSVERITCNPGL